MKTWIRIVVVSSLALILLGPSALVTGTEQENATAGTLTFVSGPSVSGVPIFPVDHIWNTPVDRLPVDSRSGDYVGTIGSIAYLHADFGSGLYLGNPIGIPFNIVNGSHQKKTVLFEYADESDFGPYPIPDNPFIEGGSDHHMVIIDRDAKILYELYGAEKHVDGSWSAGSGAVFNLSGYSLRPSGWTSADAAGLAILPGLVRYDEVNTGEINHALRFTAPSTRRAYIWPARHYASSVTDPTYPPMGQRFRLKSSFNTSGFPYQAQIVLNALKKYGMILSDNGAPWYITGVPDDRWDNDALHSLHQIQGSDFEAVDSSSLIINQDSGQALIIPANTNTSHRIGVFRNGMVYLRNSNSNGAPDISFAFGTAGDVPIVGDWDGNGVDSMGVFRNGMVYLRNSNSNGAPDISFAFGAAGDVPVIGDWDGNGVDSMGVFRNGMVYLRNSNSNGAPDISFAFGSAGDVPVIGDWDGNGRDSMGVFRNGIFYLRNSNSNGAPDISFAFGSEGDIPVVGDWDGNGRDSMGVFRNGIFYLRNSNSNGAPDVSFAFGSEGDIPVIGDWDGK